MNLPTLSRPASSSASAPAEDSHLLLAKIAVGLAVLTLLIFLPVVSMNWVNFDDDVFVTNNPKVAPGLTWAGVKWAFTTTAIDFWRPLSWLSHMVDVELYGVTAGGHHLTNLLIHIAATVMLLVALHRLTGEIWPSAMVAALFAWHPLHVESVAWIAERKDVLCGFFWFFTLWAYARYVERPGNGRYFLVLVGFALGLMSKPMIVTLPCVLLLLDFWPLRRFELPAGPFWRSPDWPARIAIGWQLLKEKIPLFAAVIVLSLSTMTSQREVGTMTSLPLVVKVSNMFLSYATYLRQTVWPVDLCILYPYPTQLPLGPLLAAVLLLGSLSTLLLIAPRQRPYLVIGWLWFLGVLVPVVGLIQVGDQAHADRYTYVPLVGVFLAVVWGLTRWARTRPRLGSRLTGVAVAVLLACAGTTRMQLRHWEDSTHLFTRAVEVNPANATMHNNLGADLLARGKHAEAAVVLERGVAVERTPHLLWNLSWAYFKTKDSRSEAILAEAFTKQPRGQTADEMLAFLRTAAEGEGENRVRARKLIALAEAIRLNYRQAAKELAEVTRLDPSDLGARTDQAAYLSMVGQETEALAILEETVKLAPTNSLALSNLGGLLARKDRLQEAIVHFRTALKIAPDNPDTRHNLAVALARDHQAPAARVEYETVLRQKPDHLPALQQLAWLLATHPACLDAPQALRLAQRALAARRSPGILDTVAAACAANGDFTGAIQYATQALELERRDQRGTRGEAIWSRLQLYQAGRAYTQPAVPGR